MWNPFKKKQVTIEQKPKYRVETVTKDYLIHRYNITIKMQNGEIFKTEKYDFVYPNSRHGNLITGTSTYARYTESDVELNTYNTNTPDINIGTYWEFDYSGTTMKLNSSQISWVQHTKIPFETRQMEEDTLVLIEETSNE